MPRDLHPVALVLEGGAHEVDDRAVVLDDQDAWSSRLGRLTLRSDTDHPFLRRIYTRKQGACQ